VCASECALPLTGRADFGQSRRLDFVDYHVDRGQLEVGRQVLNASLNDVGSLLHELCHALGMMHEHQREDRDDYVIFHPRARELGPDQYEKRDTASQTPTYDFQSLMHYPVGDVGNPIIESRTGVLPPPTSAGAGR
jgi:Astacin (Peptidase family M12A)